MPYFSSALVPCSARCGLAHRLPCLHRPDRPSWLPLHLRQGRHHGEDHGTHWGGRVHVSPTQVQPTQPSTPTPQPPGKSQHVLRRPTQTIQRGDDRCVPRFERSSRSAELRTRCTPIRHSTVHIHFIAPHADTQKVRHLTVRVLLAR